MNSKNKNCENCKNDFQIEVEDFSFYEKMGIQVPKICPQCRLQNRMLFRNFKTLYKRPSSKSGDMIVSVYSPEVKFPVYSVLEWWSDDWDPMSYGMDFDSEKPFFSQLLELSNKVPRWSMMNSQCENCEYSNQINKSKNCYMISGGLDDEDCDYGHIVWNSKDSIDNLYLFKSESCYECIDCVASNKLSYSQECESCLDSIGLFDCRNCLNCIGCVGLVGKSYCIFNKQVTKEEYKEFLLKYPLNQKSSIEYILRERDTLRESLPQRSFFGSRNNGVSGNHIYNAHNVHYSFDVKSGENSKFCFTVRKAIDSYDASFTGELSECYQVLTMLNSNKVIGSETILDSHDIYYSNNCYNSDNLFGCYGLRKKSYCILNKQYSKEEYMIIKDKIIEQLKSTGDFGAFFPRQLSPFGYNEAIVNEYMPMTKDAALSNGFTWKDNIPGTKGQGTIENSKLPTNPEEYSDRLIQEILTCENCDKNYKLINREINFYKKNKLSIPNKCFNCRHAARMKKRNPRVLFAGTCAKCNKKIQTSYTTEDQLKYKVYCEKCYQQEVY